MEDIEKIFRQGKYSIGTSIGSKDIKLNIILNDIDDRLTLIESRYLKTDKKTSTTRAQQILMLHHLGVLKKLDDYNISSKKKAKLLSILLNASSENIEDDLTVIHRKESKLIQKHNYEPIVKAFKEAGVKDIAQETDQILDNILKSEK